MYCLQIVKYKFNNFLEVFGTFWGLVISYFFLNKEKCFLYFCVSLFPHITPFTYFGSIPHNNISRYNNPFRGRANQLLTSFALVQRQRWSTMVSLGEMCSQHIGIHSRSWLARPRLPLQIHSNPNSLRNWVVTVPASGDRTRGRSVRRSEPASTLWRKYTHTRARAVCVCVCFYCSLI